MLFLRSLLVWLFVGASVWFGCVPSVAVQAHDLIPPEAVEYIAQHPTATAEDITIFLQRSTSSAPEMATSIQARLTVMREVRGFFQNAWQFLWFGITHILSGPDHVLFVLSLLLVFASWREIAQLTGTFTLAHSVTLILAGTGVLILSSRIVEPVIAFSISCMALSSVFFKALAHGRRQHLKIASVFLFGLFHGLGFAGLLTEIQVPAERFLSSLIFFNVGIEFGQVTIVLCVLPFILFGKRYTWYPKAVRVAALLIGAIGLWWGIERIIS